MVPWRATSRRAIVVNSIEATHHGHCCPSRQDISRSIGCAWRCRRVRRRSVGRAHGDGEGWHLAAAPGVQAAAGRSDRCSKAMMAIWCVCFAVCSGGPSDSSAIPPSARSMDYSPVGPGSASWRRLLDRLRRWRPAARPAVSTPEPSAVAIDRSLLSLGAELLCARHRLRQEDPRRQDPDSR